MNLSNEYIRGVIEGEGCFSFCSRPGTIVCNGVVLQPKIPAFLLTMHARDLELVEAIKEKMGLKNKVYVYRAPALVTNKKVYTRGQKAMLIVRDFGSLKNIIIPFFYKKLKGNKGKQFEEWLERIGSEPFVPESYKLIYRLYKCGFYDKNVIFKD